MSKASFAHRFFLAAALFGLAGCTISQTQTPGLTGPSEFALSFNLTATPDQMIQDGSSQSRIVLTALDPNGAPRAGVSFRLDQTLDGHFVDFDTLSTKTLTTDANGRATVLFTSPAAPPSHSGPVATCSTSNELPGHRVGVLATPIGTDFAANITQLVEIRLIPPPTVALPSSGPSGPSAPLAAFIYGPLVPNVGQEILFDASGSRAANGRRLVTYRWDWGDGFGSPDRSDPHEDHDYDSACTYPVTLTVTDDAGQSSSVLQMIAIH